MQAVNHNALVNPVVCGYLLEKAFSNSFGVGRSAMDAWDGLKEAIRDRRAPNGDLISVKGGEMELPEIITRLPEADLPFPSTTVKTNVLQSEQGQVVFFQILKDVDACAQS